MLLACSIALTGCSGGNSGSETGSAVTAESTSGTTATTTADTTAAPETTTTPQITVPTVEVTVPTAESTEPTAETAQTETPMAVELIGKTIGDIETIFDVELFHTEQGYAGSHTFDSTGKVLGFVPLAQTLEENYKDSVVTGLFIASPYPIIDGMTGNMSYNEMNAIVGGIEPPEMTEMDETMMLMFLYKGYKFMVMWTDFTDLDSPCYSVTITAE